MPLPVFRARHHARAFVVAERDPRPPFKARAYGCRACNLRLTGMSHARALRLYARHACAPIGLAPPPRRRKELAPPREGA